MFIQPTQPSAGVRGVLQGVGDGLLQRTSPAPRRRPRRRRRRRAGRARPPGRARRPPGPPGSAPRRSRGAARGGAEEPGRARRPAGRTGHRRAAIPGRPPGSAAALRPDQRDSPRRAGPSPPGTAPARRRSAQEAVRPERVEGRGPAARHRQALREQGGGPVEVPPHPGDLRQQAQAPAHGPRRRCGAGGPEGLLHHRLGARVLAVEPVVGAERDQRPVSAAGSPTSRHGATPLRAQAGGRRRSRPGSARSGPPHRAPGRGARPARRGAGIGGQERPKPPRPLAQRTRCVPPVREERQTSRRPGSASPLVRQPAQGRAQVLVLAVGLLQPGAARRPPGRGPPDAPLAGARAAHSAAK